MSDLSQRAQELLRAGRSGLEPGPGAADRVRDRLAETVATSSGGEAGAGTGVGTSAGVKVALAVVGVSAAIAIAYVVLKPGGGEARPGAEPTVAAPAAEKHDAGPELAEAARDAAPEPVFEPAEIDAGAPFEATSNRRGPRPARHDTHDAAAAPELAKAQASDEARRARSLMDELRFIEGARSLLSSGSPERALEVIERHADEFPAGQLGQEAAELRVRALCAAKRRDEAEKAASRLGERWPDSPFAARNGPACGS